ncbi:hypothetical protein ACFZBP_16775 [Streptomyces sp. NPDC008086]|uniref:hypothetical protein n=1 Tax=Streptomyces sp. NPDC008086 TaxID=3364807 RepID=UPI0036EF3EB8
MSSALARAGVPAGPQGARTLFPPERVAGTPEEAARRILATTATEETWLKAGQAAAEHALSAWDWTVVRDDFDRLLIGGHRKVQQ